MTKAERDRNYHLQMYALSEENRIMRLPKEELKRRMREIWHNCYDSNKETENENA